MARSLASFCLVWSVLVLTSDAALAQRPGFDCATATSAIQRTVCGNDHLAAADRAMTAAFTALVGTLDVRARAHLTADQSRWLANRERACVGDPGDVLECLMARYRERTARLKLFADGAYPFVSEQAIVMEGVARGIPYSIDASYPQFDSTSADFGAVNRALATATREAADRAVPGPDADNGGGTFNGASWRYEQSFVLNRPGPDALAVHIVFDSYEGGAYAVGGSYGTLVDLHTGEVLGPQDVFLPGEGWLTELTRLVGVDIKAPNLRELLKNPGRYVFLEDRLELSFNRYEGGPHTLELPYERLKSLLRPDGPIPR